MQIRGEFRIDPDCLATDDASEVLDVVIPFTGTETTAAALERAASLTAGLNAKVLLIAVHTLPYPVPFVCPSMVHAHLVEQLIDLASHCTLPVQPQVILARDRMEGFLYALKPRSTVLVASRQQAVFHTQEEKLARALVEAGHKVALLYVG